MNYRPLTTVAKSMSAAAIRASQKAYVESAASVPVKPSSASTASARATNQVICFGGDSLILFLPLSSTRTSWFSIHAPLTLLSVFWARAIPARMASSKLLGEEALISVTRATDIGELLSLG